MDQETIQRIMIAIAVALPVVSASLLLMARSGARGAETEMVAKLRRTGWLLIVIGPLNLLVWLLLNNWLDRIGYRSVVGYLLAAVVFFITGWMTGLFARWDG